jgi:diamine N-acetyltransferase
MNSSQSEPKLTLMTINNSNWRKVIRIKVKPEQLDYVAEPSYYLLLCQYGELWQPLAVTIDDQVIGFIMWAIDPQDGSCWLGGFHLDADWQGKGYGRLTLQTAIKMLSEQEGTRNFALSVLPNNPAIKLYKSVGFVETNEMEDDEMVMRFSM